MYDLLDLLYDYSAKERIVDHNFFDKILDYYWNGLKEYLNCLSFEKIKQDRVSKDAYAPMAYSFYDKKIYIDEEIIKENFINEMIRFQRLGIDTSLRIFAYNSLILYFLLHELDHPTQYKKAVENNGTFESTLLNLCFYPEIEILAKPKTFSRLKEYFGITNLYAITPSFIKTNHSFDRVVPYERLAQIDSAKQILGLLEVFDADIAKIPDVLRFFKGNLFTQYLVGYDKPGDAPLISYLNEIKKLNCKELNKPIAKIESRLDELQTVDEKVRFGLNVTPNEFSELKRRTLR